MTKNNNKKEKSLVALKPSRQHSRPIILTNTLPKDKGVFDHFDTKVIILDRNMKVQLINRAAEKALGVTSNEVKGKDFLEVKAKTTKKDLSKDLNEVMGQLKTLNQRELHHLGPDQTARLIDFSYVPMVNDKGEIEGILSFGQDVTEAIDSERIEGETAHKVQDLLSQLDQQNLRIIELQNQLEDRYQFHNIIGKNPKMGEVYTLIEKIAPTDSTVLITGETGVGKELVAKAVHFNSTRKNKPLISINCAALPETLLESELFGHVKGSFTGAFRDKKGKFELAQGGTLFLDELGEMSLTTQVKLLRVIQEREIERIGDEKKISIDIRIIAATNQNLAQEVEKGTFRKDLYYRLKILTIHIPPLRERLDDIPLLSRFFIDRFNERLNKTIKSISPKVQQSLMTYNWPGNVRELEGVLEKAVILSDGDQIEDLYQTNIDELPVKPTTDSELLHQQTLESTDLHSQTFQELEDILSETERNYFLEIFTRYRGRINDIAEHSGLTRRTILNKMKKYGIEKKNFK